MSNRGSPTVIGDRLLLNPFGEDTKDRGAKVLRKEAFALASLGGENSRNGISSANTRGENNLERLTVKE